RVRGWSLTWGSSVRSAYDGSVAALTPFSTVQSRLDDSFSKY
ncbi:MAG: hypothetical protein QOJ60_1495, partial [Actinomycetota bacterium]|nr:hypothetical protein [Actinomycetota bacterium]